MAVQQEHGVAFPGSHGMLVFERHESVIAAPCEHHRLVSQSLGRGLGHVLGRPVSFLG